MFITMSGPPSTRAALSRMAVTAPVVADAVIRHAFAQGATEIGWHCWAANTPSVATALKLGFEKVLDYPVCYGHYRPVLT